MRLWLETRFKLETSDKGKSDAYRFITLANVSLNIILFGIFVKTNDSQLGKKKSTMKGV